MSTDRPTPRSRPRPPADADLDPADLAPGRRDDPPARRTPTPAPAAEAPAPRASAPRRAKSSTSDSLPDDLPLAEALQLMQSGGPTKQLGLRISEPVYNLLAQTARDSNTKQRTLLEYAIVKAFATEEGKRTWRVK
ncbi:MAG TPA: hypothetical protein VKY86_10275 [Promicromonospora sp.]|nr:hypothetical protein [Promicromonospora sp.]